MGRLCPQWVEYRRSAKGGERTFGQFPMRSETRDNVLELRLIGARSSEAIIGLKRCRSALG